MRIPPDDIFVALNLPPRPFVGGTGCRWIQWQEILESLESFVLVVGRGPSVQGSLLRCRLVSKPDQEVFISKPSESAQHLETRHQRKETQNTGLECRPALAIHGHKETSGSHRVLTTLKRSEKKRIGKMEKENRKVKEWKGGRERATG